MNPNINPCFPSIPFHSVIIKEKNLFIQEYFYRRYYILHSDIDTSPRESRTRNRERNICVETYRWVMEQSGTITPRRKDNRINEVRSAPLHLQQAISRVRVPLSGNLSGRNIIIWRAACSANRIIVYALANSNNSSLSLRVSLFGHVVRASNEMIWSNQDFLNHHHIPFPPPPSSTLFHSSLSQLFFLSFFLSFFLFFQRTRSDRVVLFR